MDKVSLTERPPKDTHKEESTPNRILEGLRLARDRRDEFRSLADGGYMVPSRTTPGKLYHVGPDGSYCGHAYLGYEGCPDSVFGGWRCAHRVAVLALEVARRECKGSGFEHELRVEAVLDLMVKLQSPAPAWASARWMEVHFERLAWEARALMGVSKRMREMLAGEALGRRDAAKWGGA